MTYPQYAPPQQPAYAPPQPPVQHYAPQPQPTYAQPPQPAATGGQGIVPPVPQLRNGSSGNGGTAAPKLRHLLGRTIIVEPIRMDETATVTETVNGQQVTKSAPEAYFNLTVVDGGPVRYGDNQSRDPNKQRPNTHEIDTPCRFTNINDNGYGFTQCVRDALAAGEAGRVGVVQQGTKGNFPYLITETGLDVEKKPRPDGEARYAAAMALYGKIWHDKHAPSTAPKQFVSPEPRSLVAPPSAPPAQVAYQPAPQQGTVVHEYGAPASAQGPYVPQYAPQPTYAAPASSADQEYAAYMAAQAQPYTPPTAPQLPPHIEAWLASLPAEQQAGALAQYLAQTASQQQPVAAAGPGF